MTPTADSLQGFRNRIINGGMVIDQRNAGASVTPTISIYTLDRWLTNLTQASKFSVQQSSTAPTGFNNSLLVTSASAFSVASSDYFAVLQNVEGFNFSDCGWGTANAKTVTLSFWVRSSLTGTFGGSITNSAINRSYPFTYTINSANTFEYKTVTIAGDTTGTWIGSTNGIGVRIWFGLGAGSTYSGTAGAWAGAIYISATGATSVVGTSGATLYITGVQLEVGSVATPFERRPYGTELALCQRYYYRIYQPVDNSFFPNIGLIRTSTSSRNSFQFPVEMRIIPSALDTTGTASDYRLYYGGTASDCSIVPSISDTTTIGGVIVATVASGLTAGGASIVASGTPNAYLGWSAEL
jgi:hypothetical protein